MTNPEQFSTLDIVQLSDLAWTVVDPDGTHETEEAAWTAALPRDWPPPRTTRELAVALADRVDSLRGTASPGRLKLVATLMCFLADHPEHAPLGEAVLREALDAAFAAEDAPEEIRDELAERAARVDAHVKTHITRHPAQRVRLHPVGEFKGREA